jgi:hypothetical protein
MGCTIAIYGTGSRRIGRLTYPQLMRISYLLSRCYRIAMGLIMLMLLSGTGFAQGASIATLNDDPLSFGPVDPGPENPSPATLAPANSGAVAVSPVVANTPPEAPSQHKFWDNENRTLFVAVAVLSAADFAVTRANLQNGGRELNPVTRLFSGSTAGLAANFAGETAGIIGLSYYFHKTGHHQLERLTPLLNIGASTFAVVYDLNHR